MGIQLVVDDGELREGVVDLGGYGGEGRRIDARAGHGGWRCPCVGSLIPICYGLTRSGRLERLAGQETRPDRRRTGCLRLVLFFFDNSNPRTQATFID